MPGLPAHQDLVGGQHAGIPGEEPVQLFGEYLSIQAAGERHAAAPQDEVGRGDARASVYGSALNIETSKRHAVLWVPKGLVSRIQW